MTRAGALLGALLLAGCGASEPAAPPAPPAAESPAPPPTLAKATRSTAWVCEKDMPITAIYGTDAAGQPDLALIVKGQSFALKPTAAASGVRFATADGLEPGMGLVWWEKGAEAVLQQVPADRLADMAAPQTIRTCRPKA